MTNEKKKHDNTMKNRKVLRVPFFSDEFEALGVSTEDSYYNAVAMIRSKTGCVIGARTRAAGISKNALFNQFANATPEQRKMISKILGQEQEDY